MPACPICLVADPNLLRDPAFGDSRFYNCPRCGRFEISGTAETLIPLESVTIRGLLSAVTRLSAIRGTSVKVTTDALPNLVASAPRWTTLSEGIDRLLLEFSRLAKGYISPVDFDPAIDYPVVCALTQQECEDLIEMAERMGYLDQNLMTISVQGWLHIDELRQVLPRSTQAFVAMWFSDDLVPAWKDGFKPGIEDGGHFKAMRIDLVQHNQKIDDRIIAEIRRSGLLVADFTGHRGGVYFEAGYAMGLGLPVIWTCRSDHIGDAHFDTRQYNHIVWDTPEALRSRLADRIAATVLPAPHVA